MGLSDDFQPGAGCLPRYGRTITFGFKSPDLKAGRVNLPPQKELEIFWVLQQEQGWVKCLMANVECFWIQSKHLVVCYPM